MECVVVAMSLKIAARRALAQALPPLRKADERLALAQAALSEASAQDDQWKGKVEAEISSLREQVAALAKPVMDPPAPPPPEPATELSVEEAACPYRIRISRGGRHWTVGAEAFELLALRDGDELEVLPEDERAKLPFIWGDVHVPIAPGHAIRAPGRWETAEFKGFRMPSHLVRLTGAGPETLDTIGKALLSHYRKFVGIEPGMTILDLGSGIGRLAFQLLDVLGEDGRYVGVDIIRDSIDWCRDNITARHPNFEFHHFDAFSELYNPFGALQTSDVRLPVPDGSVDRIVLASVFTHLVEDEVGHYLKEFARVLKKDGRVYASFFLYSAEALEAAKTKGKTQWTASFQHDFGNGVYGNDPTFPRGAVAFTDEAIRRLVAAAGLELKRPYIKGWWSGLHADPEDGQDAMVLGLP